MNVYIASSWKNEHQPTVVEYARACGHEAFDFRHPEEGDFGLRWESVDPEWEKWTPEQFSVALADSIVLSGYRRGKYALDKANAGVLVLPSGRSAHLEAGYLVARKRPVCVFFPEGEPATPELMYLLAEQVVTSYAELIRWLTRLNEPRCVRMAP